MKRLLLLLVTVLAAGPAAAGVTAFVNVNVLPMSSDGVLPAQTVIVEDGTIAAIGDVDSIPVPDGAMVVDGTDRYLMPGLVEMHAHISDADAHELERVLTLFAANGVTTVRGMLGQPSHLQLREELRGARFGPRLITSGPSLNGDSVHSPAQAREFVLQQRQAGFDFLKIHPGLSVAEFDAIAKAARETGMPFVGHVTESVGLRGVLAAGQKTVEHLDGYMEALMPPNADRSGGYGGFFGVLLADQVDTGLIPELVQATIDVGAWNVPTESVFEHLVSAMPVGELLNRPEMQYVPAATLQRWTQARREIQSERGFTPELARRAIEIRRRLIRSLHEAGAGLLLGSDAPQLFNVPGYALHDELALMVESGLSSIAALRAGTVLPAAFLGTNTGSVAPGRDADLVLLDANPLVDISNSRRVNGVMLRGSWYGPVELGNRLDALIQERD